MNKLILIGNVGMKPDVRTLENGSKVVNFSLATTERWTNKAGTVVEQTEWHRIEGWNYVASAIEKSVEKGDRLFIEGKIATQKWTDNEGNEKSSTKVRITRIEFLGYRREQVLKDDASDSEENTKPMTAKSKKAKAEKDELEKGKVVFEASKNDEDLPF